MEKLKEIINVILKNREKPTVEKINDSDSLTEDLGLESLDLAELTVRLEAEFDIDVFEDGIVLTVGEILDKIKVK